MGVPAHFAESPAFVINLARSRDRWNTFTTETGQLFAVVHHVLAVDGLDVTEAELVEWMPRAFETHKTLIPNGMKKFDAPAPIEKVKRQPLMWRTAAAGRAIYFSHRRALLAGVRSGYERFFIVEDDIAVRDSFWDAPMPPDDSEFSIWGGALPRFNMSDDTKLFLRGKPHQWKSIPTGSSQKMYLGAGCYEVTREAALILLRRTTEWVGQWDVVWSTAMGEVPTYRITPELMPQAGPSARNGTSRSPILFRDSPEAV